MGCKLRAYFRRISANVCRLGLSDFLREKVVERLRSEEKKLRG